MINVKLYVTLPCFLLGGLWACDSSLNVTVTNPSDNRRKEIVSVKYEVLRPFIGNRDDSVLRVRETGNDQYLVTQWIDYDPDGAPDELLFFVEMDPFETKEYEILLEKNSNGRQAESKLTTYSRFVPERTDDYAWENDKVAFRTYGPEAQRLVESNEPGGTLSSGIDLWLKCVDYPVIDKWYAANDAEPGYYHIDHGEGYDPYHVGTSRGTGGIGIWQQDTLLTSKNFTSYRTIATGPLRTIFELDYGPWGDYGVAETKRISLDLGSNFSKVELFLETKEEVPNVAIGITTHDGNGETKLRPEEGWFRHWEKIDDAYLGEGIVISPSAVIKAFVHSSGTPDQSQLLILADSDGGPLTYYAGFGWTKSGQVATKADWDDLILRQVKVLSKPLIVKIGE